MTNLSSKHKFGNSIPFSNWHTCEVWRRSKKSVERGWTWTVGRLGIGFTPEARFTVSLQGDHYQKVDDSKQWWTIDGATSWRTCQCYMFKSVNFSSGCIYMDLQFIKFLANKLLIVNCTIYSVVQMSLVRGSYHRFYSLSPHFVVFIHGERDLSNLREGVGENGPYMDPV